MTPYDTTDYGDIWSQTIAAADYLAATTHPGLTVWHALAEAAHTWAASLVDDETESGQVPVWDDPDPLRTSLEALLARTPPAGSPGATPLADTLTAALTVWLADVAEHVNDGHPFRLSRSFDDALRGSSR